MFISDLQTAHLSNPVGYQLKPLSFSWVSQQKARGYRVLLASDPNLEHVIYDSGMRADIKPHAFSPEWTPEPKTRYYWQVLTEDLQNTVHRSEIAYFETGLMGLPFQGQWITAPFSQKRHPYFHKNFTVDREIEEARLYVTGLGLYEVEINGEKVGDEYLSPYFNDYNEWIQVSTYDVTEYLQEGENAIGSLLGNGWYKGRFSFVADKGELMGDHFSLLLDLEIRYTDGSQETIKTDESWLALPSLVLESSIYDGEHVDANLDIKGRSTTAADLSDASLAVSYDYSYDRLEDRLSPPLIVMEEIREPKLIRTPAGEDVLDFGQVLTGWLRFCVREPQGSRVYLQFGELLQEDNFYRDNLRSAKAEYSYISDGEERVVRPYFTFYGFRYVKVTGVSEIRPEDFVAEVVYSELRQTGSIETGHEKVNKLFSNALWGQKGNFLDVPTDCPQRDERMGWTGDAQVFARTASFNMDTAAFFNKYLHDMLKEQRVRGGAVPHVVPDFIRVAAPEGIAFGDSSASAAWADAATVIPWVLYTQYGDKELLRGHYENMRFWVDYIKGVDDQECGGKRLWKHGFHFGDWLALDNPDNLRDPEHNSSFGGTDPHYISSAYYFYSTMLTAKAAKALGYTEDAAAYETLAEEIRAAFVREYFETDGRCKIQTQTAQILALHFGILAPEEKAPVIADLKRLLDENNGHLATGFVGTAYLCPTLSDHGLHDYAVNLLLNEAYPGWLYAINMGATTVWERWNSVREDGLVSDTGMNSMNHYAYGVIVEWMYRYLGGINPLEDQPGFRAARIAPMPDKRLGHFTMSYRSAYGLYKSAWRYEEDGILYTITIPAMAEASVQIANEGSYTLNGVLQEGAINLDLAAGTYEIKTGI